MRLSRLEKNLLLLATALGVALLSLVLFDPALYFRLDIHVFGALRALLEIGSVLVGFSVFIVNWEASKQNRNSQSLFIATGFLAVSVLDVMHNLADVSLPFFATVDGSETEMYFWLLARFWGAAILLTATFVPSSDSGRLLSRYPLAAANLALCLSAFVAFTWYPSYLPSIPADETGAAGFGLRAQYAIIAMNLAAAGLYLRRFRLSGDDALAIIGLALTVSAYSQVCYMMYRDTSDIYSLLGLGYKVVAYYILFRGLIVSSVERPYIQLRKSNEDLAEAVAELNERTRELDALDEVALTLSSSLRPDELLSSAMDKIMVVMQACAGAIFLVDDVTGELQVAAWMGLKASAVAQFHAHPMALRNIAAAKGAVGGRALGEGPPGTSPQTTRGRVSPLHTCVCAPVTTKGQLLGAITMLAGEGRSFGTSDIDLLTAVGYQLGLAVENSRLYGRTDEKLREKLFELGEAERKSRFLAESGALLAGSMDLDKVLAIVAKKASEVVGDWCAVYLVGERDKELRLAAVYHADQDELEEIRVILSRGAPGAGNGLLGKVAKTGEAILVSGEGIQRLSLEVEALVHTPEELSTVRRTLPSSAIIAPMRARGATVGVLVVMETHSSEPLTELDRALVVELGDRAGVAVQNSQLLEESQAQRRHLETVISQMVDGVVIADADGKIVVSNTAADRMLRGQLGALVGETTTDEERQVEAQHVEERIPLIMRAIDGDPVLGDEIVIAGDTGERVLSASASAVRNDDGEVTGAVVVMRDVTAEREVEKMKDEFIATVSHELRTPITAVLGYTDLLLRGMRGPLAPAQSDALSAVRNAGRRLLTLIEDLLDISKLEAGKQELFLEVIDVPAAIERALLSVSLAASSKRVRIERRVPPDIPPVLADDPQLQRILGNLLSNAVKFTPQDGVVTISARLGAVGAGEHEPAVVTFLVGDTGVGIPRDKQERIWEKFQQADGSSSRLFGGTGLGLAIVKSLVELHGGRVWVESEGIPGKGSTFGFTMPATDLGNRTDGIAMPQYERLSGGSE